MPVIYPAPTSNGNAVPDDDCTGSVCYLLGSHIICYVENNRGSELRCTVATAYSTSIYPICNSNTQSYYNCMDCISANAVIGW